MKVELYVYDICQRYFLVASVKLVAEANLLSNQGLARQVWLSHQNNKCFTAHQSSSLQASSELILRQYTTQQLCSGVSNTYTGRVYKPAYLAAATMVDRWR